MTQPSREDAESLTRRIDAAVALSGDGARDADVLAANHRRLARDAGEWLPAPGTGYRSERHHR